MRILCSVLSRGRAESRTSDRSPFYGRECRLARERVAQPLCSLLGCCAGTPPPSLPPTRPSPSPSPLCPISPVSAYDARPDRLLPPRAPDDALHHQAALPQDRHLARRPLALLHCPSHPTRTLSPLSKNDLSPFSHPRPSPRRTGGERPTRLASPGPSWPCPSQPKSCIAPKDGPPASSWAEPGLKSCAPPSPLTLLRRERSKT